MEFLNIFELKAKFPESTEWVAETPKFLKISIKAVWLLFRGNGVELRMKQIRVKKIYT